MSRNINDVVLINQMKEKLDFIEHENSEIQYNLGIARSKMEDREGKKEIQEAIERSFKISNILGS